MITERSSTIMSLEWMYTCSVVGGPLSGSCPQFRSEKKEMYLWRRQFEGCKNSDLKVATYCEMSTSGYFSARASIRLSLFLLIVE